MDTREKLILQYIDSITYDDGTLSVSDNTVVDFQDQDEQLIIRTACPVPGVNRGWLGNLTVTKEYAKLTDCTAKVKSSEVLPNMLCIRVNTHVGNEVNAVTEYVFLKY